MAMAKMNMSASTTPEMMTADQAFLKNVQAA
jgi:hypothetical protein